MISDLLKIILVEIIILYIGIRILYKYYKEDQIDNENRMLQLEKRINDYSKHDRMRSNALMTRLVTYENNTEQRISKLERGKKK